MDSEHASLLRRRMWRHGRDIGRGGELNVVPYLDIITNLVMFMLQAGAVATSLGELRTALPPAQGRLATLEPPPPPLTVILEQGRVTLVPPDASPRVEVEAREGEVDCPALARAAVEYKRTHPRESRVMLVPADAVSAEQIVTTLDCVREQGPLLLFPDVMFAAI